jgi:hypothetical protein
LIAKLQFARIPGLVSCERTQADRLNEGWLDLPALGKELSMLGRLLTLSIALSAGSVAMTASAASAPQASAVTGQLERETIVKLLRPVTVELTGQRLEDVMRYLTDVTGAEIDVLWMDDSNAVGLDPEQTINLRVRNASALSMLERILEQAATNFGEPGSYTWQFTTYGTFEIGPKERLNRNRRVEVYDINDLLFEVPDFTEAPTFDLNSVLQGNQGGGGGQSPFQQTGQGQNQRDDRPTRQDLADDLIAMITQIVETEQWEDNGGDGATIRYYQGHLLVNGPDYVHRGINGYRWWPARLTQRIGAKNTRTLTLTSDELERSRRDRILIDPTRPAVRPVRGGAAKPEATPAKP